MAGGPPLPGGGPKGGGDQVVDPMNVVAHPGGAPVGGPISMAGGPPLPGSGQAEVDQVVDPMNVVAQIPVAHLQAHSVPRVPTADLVAQDLAMSLPMVGLEMHGLCTTWFITRQPRGGFSRADSVELSTTSQCPR